MTKKKVVSITDYASLCKVSITTIRRRIKKGLIILTKTNGVSAIDLSKFPPRGPISVGRPKDSSIINSKE